MKKIEYGIVCGDILINRIFSSYKEAVTWGNWNYKGNGNWKCVKLPYTKVIRGQGSHFTAKDFIKIKKLRAKGLNIKQIAEKTKWSRYTVSGYLSYKEMPIFLLERLNDKN